MNLSAIPKIKFWITSKEVRQKNWTFTYILRQFFRRLRQQCNNGLGQYNFTHDKYYGYHLYLKILHLFCACGSNCATSILQILNQTLLTGLARTLHNLDWTKGIDVAQTNWLHNFDYGHILYYYNHKTNESCNLGQQLQTPAKESIDYNVTSGQR